MGRAADAGHGGNTTMGTGVVLYDASWGRGISSTVQDAAPLAWQMAVQ